jgi:hypothetical protein
MPASEAKSVARTLKHTSLLEDGASIPAPEGRRPGVAEEVEAVEAVGPRTVFWLNLKMGLA